MNAENTLRGMFERFKQVQDNRVFSYRVYLPIVERFWCYACKNKWDV